MWVTKYGCDCIKNMEWLESYKIFIQSKQIIAFTLMLPMIVNSIDEKNNVSDKVWM